MEAGLDARSARVSAEAVEPLARQLRDQALAYLPITDDFAELLADAILRSD